ncbi:3614_t:CDS:2 [Paraglomus occultum]|uniref:3614_t:CDS:1 n=1 Tax=Paraglomus occultum TaxID=144539 RepID=A0A9N9CLS0_9GLOM|nr:3614_t:CDS:2 [Paraglomus occultum]
MEAIEFIAAAQDCVTINTIKNCWCKTGILSSPVCEIVDVAGPVLNSERFINSLSDEQHIVLENYIHQLNVPVPIEEPLLLSFEQIVDLVNEEDIECTSDDSSEEVSPVQLKEAQIGLETAINFFEQQSDNIGFDIKDLHIFHKYLNLLNVKEFQLKQQQKIDAYFGS